MANYCDNDDLVAERPNILSYGVTDFTAQITEATAKINRVIEARWYREAAGNFSYDFRETPMSPDLFLNADTQLKNLAVYKSLELIYKYLMKDSPEEDAFERQMKNYKKEYSDELASVLESGLDYDWDGSDSITSAERYQQSTRTLTRI